MSETRTGGFPIGFRRGWSEWQRDLKKVLSWAKSTDFSAIDLGKDGDIAGKEVKAAGFRIGSVDLKEWSAMISPDKGKRASAVADNGAYVRACAALGEVNHFLVMLPEQAGRPRLENFGFLVESFGALAPVLEESHARLVVEGWPGPGALCCTPEEFREFFKECPSAALGINYDPSHLVRMGIDPLRFLEEFSGRVFHVHGKDTELFPDALYAHGNLLPPLKAKGHGFGEAVWRYTIPGHGVVGWSRVFKILKETGYRGCVSIELEDENFNGSEEGEKTGLNLGRCFLTGC